MATTRKSAATSKRSATKSVTKSRTKSRTKSATRSATKRGAARRSSTKGGALKDPKGGLTAAGRARFKQTEGANLRPGVRGAADTPEKMRRKGSFLRRHFATLRGPLVDEHGEPTRLALSAHAWGEPVPKTTAAAKKLAERGARLLERYAATKERTADGDDARKRGARKSGARKRGTRAART